MRAALRNVGGGVLDLLAPHTCAACGLWVAGDVGLLCDDCREECTRDLARPYCPRCGRTLPAAAIHDDHCARCRTEHYWNVRRIARAGLYSNALRHVILRLKHGGDERCADYLAGLLDDALAPLPWRREIDALAPVPMHWLRRAQRPCDHAWTLAAALGARMKLPLVRLLRRRVNTPSQTSFPTKNQRLENVRGCFAPRASWWPARGRPLEGRTVCVVDNLALSGGTLCEVAKVVRGLGARHVYGLVVARPASPGDPPIGEPPYGTDEA